MKQNWQRHMDRAYFWDRMTGIANGVAKFYGKCALLAHRWGQKCNEKAKEAANAGVESFLDEIEKSKKAE